MVKTNVKTKKPKKLVQLDEQIINDAIYGESSLSIDEATLRAIRKVPGPLVVKYAAYLKYTYSALFGMTDQDWLNQAAAEIAIVLAITGHSDKRARKGTA